MISFRCYQQGIEQSMSKLRRVPVSAATLFALLLILSLPASGVDGDEYIGTAVNALPLSDAHIH